MFGIPRGELLAKTPLALYTLCGAALLLGLAWHHYQLVTYELPLSYTEPATVTVTGTLAEGGNPHSLQSQPTRISLYPVLGNLIVVPFTYVFGNTLELHRLVSAVFILLTSLLVLPLVRRLTGSVLHAAVAATISYAGFLYYSTPVASPNGLGLFLFIASIAVPWLRGFSRGSLAFAILAGVLAFFTKQYFIAGLGYVALYLFLAVSKQSGFLFGLCSLLATLAVLVPVAASSPYFLDNTLFSMGVSVDSISSYQVMLRQLRDYSLITYPLIGALLVGMVAHWPGQGRKGGGERPAAVSVDFTRLDAPLLAARVNYFVLCLLCSLIIFVFALGKNPGNSLTYLFQLVSPFLLLVIYAYLPKMSRTAILCHLLLVLGMYNAYHMLSHDFTVRNKDNWDELRDRISAADDVYVNHIFVAEAMYNGLDIYNNGHTTYFRSAAQKPEFFRHERKEERISAIWDNYVRDLHGKIAARELDFILLDQWAHLPDGVTASGEAVKGQALLERYYRNTRVLTVSAARRTGGGGYRVRIWEPRLAEDVAQPGRAAPTVP